MSPNSDVHEPHRVLDMMLSSDQRHASAAAASNYMLQQTIQLLHFSCFRWLTHFDILSLIPINSSVSYTSLATNARVPETILKRICRAAMTSGLLWEPEPGHIAHNVVSLGFAQNQELRDLASYRIEVTAMAANKLVEATQKWGTTTSTTETAYNLAMNTELGFFDHISQSGSRIQQFAGCMKGQARGDGLNIRHVVDGLDWKSLGQATVVDIGGSGGLVSVALAQAYPSLKFVVEDLQETIQGVDMLLQQLPSHVSSRMEFISHNFFEPQPVKNADIYLMRWILHDWPDDKAVTIIGHILDILPPHGKIVIIDSVLPESGSVPRHEEAPLRLLDVSMMMLFNGREREASDWHRLIEQGGRGRLQIEKVFKPVGSDLSVLTVGLIQA